MEHDKRTGLGAGQGRSPESVERDAMIVWYCMLAGTVMLVGAALAEFLADWLR